MHSLDRRSFLKRARALTVVSVVPGFFRAALAEGFTFPPGIQLYAVRDPLATDVPGTLKRLATIGFREVETAGFGKYTAKDYRRLCDDAGLRVPSAHLPFQNAKDVSALFADANALGAQYATSSYLWDLSGPGKQIPGGPLKPTPAIGLNGFKKMAAHMNDLGTKAKAAGLQYAYHNHNFEFEKLPDGRFGYDVLLAETDPSLVTFEVDCGWMVVAGGNPVVYFQRNPGRFRMLHVKDFRPHAATTQLTGPDHPDGAELGRGFIDYKKIFPAAKAAGIEHAFAEQEGPYPRPQLESAEVSYRYLKSLG